LIFGSDCDDLGVQRLGHCSGGDFRADAPGIAQRDRNPGPALLSLRPLRPLRPADQGRAQVLIST
jgi:hypothetical protein